MSASFLSRTIILSRFLKTDKQKISTFINYNRQVHRTLKPKPYSITLVAPNSYYYQIKWDQNMYSYNFTTLVTYNDTYSIVRQFSSYEFMRTIDILNYGYDAKYVNTEEFYKSQAADTALVHEDEENPGMKLFTISTIEHSQNLTITTKIDINLEEFSNHFSNHTLLSQSYYAFFDQENHSIISSPTFNNSLLSSPTYGNDTIINKVNELDHRYSLSTVISNGNTNIISIIPLRITYSIFHHLVVICDFTQLISSSLWETSKVFLIYLSVAGFLTLLCIILLLRALNRKNKKLISINNSMESYLVNDAGILFKVIQKIRNLELNHPDETIMNRILDGVVQKIAVHNVHPYICKNHCKFCNELVNSKEYINMESLPNYYATWKDIIGSQIATYKNIGDLKFRWKLHQSHPVKYLVQLFAAILVKEDLLIPQIDPNCLIEMVKFYAENFCKDPSITALQLNAFYNIIHTQFKYWVTNKVDLLLAYIAALFFLPDYDKLAKYSYDNQFYTTQPIFEDDLITVTKVFGHPICVSFMDRVEILEFITRYIPSWSLDTDFAKYCTSTILTLLESQFVWNDISSFGALRILIESPYFSPMEESKDRETLLLFLLCYAKMAPFYSPAKISDEVAIKFLECHGIDTTDQILITNFCIEVVRNIVVPMTNNLTKFVPLDIHDKNSKAIIEHWTHKLKFISATVEDE
ncbi:hypothetical protein TVAG_327130 [Trichomonas vaginalis G3]|uniref:Uncharacterized protein n=1 Tax=Trichomonas vaginalis (strain ATCC PRA-98 / G3) TaxID=412133 RepID=A2FTR5_TRIV3|nr:hypothetical protein TVAGG3_0165380 [Trichomonas vaginalis G3]EAX91704.1 hypothetical protein TVAG_327130 [Trichomonas vaginalis G3]KAI5548181.1 hypothetical protein TVAGG3_0165380 [Trichomonas vaginalis G3]|eukprot:XP_001304634.1 hypothetical protein [Trichomonas vaginalis G3]